MAAVRIQEIRIDKIIVGKIMPRSRTVLRISPLALQDLGSIDPLMKFVEDSNSGLPLKTIWSFLAVRFGLWIYCQKNYALMLLWPVRTELYATNH